MSLSGLLCVTCRALPASTGLIVAKAPVVAFEVRYAVAARSVFFITQGLCDGRSGGNRLREALIGVRDVDAESRCIATRLARRLPTPPG